MRLLKKQHSITLLSLLSVSAVWFLIGWFARGYFFATQFMLLTPEQKLTAAAQDFIVNRQYPLHDVSSLKLSQVAIRSMLQATQDPYAAFFPPEASARFQADFSGETGVPGLLFDLQEGQIVIVDVPPGRPAARAGLQVGDIILGVDDIMFDKYTSGDEASVLLRGPVGTIAHVTVQRNGKILTLNIQREEWKTVTTTVMDKIGYLKLSAIPANAAEKMHTALQALLQQKIEAIIWDLRGSGGGSMQATQTILNNFMAEGILYQAEFKDGQRQSFSADGSAIAPTVPLVVLIDQQTYSSSEMAAIAISESGRGILIGQTTKGKGMLQDTITLDQGNLLRVSIAKWLSPSGQWFQGKGVPPTIDVVDDPTTAEDEVLAYALDYLQNK